MAWLGMVGMAVSAGASVQQGAQAEQDAKAQQNIARYNAQVMEREAQAIEQQTAFEQERQVKEAARIKSKLRVAQAGSGAMTGVGTELLIEEEQAAELELDMLLIGYEGKTAAQRARSQATLDIRQGKLYRQKGEAVRTAGYAKAGSTLLTGFGSKY